MYYNLHAICFKKNSIKLERIREQKLSMSLHSESPAVKQHSSSRPGFSKNILTEL